jgi:hypothetical protein
VAENSSGKEFKDGEYCHTYSLYSETNLR